LSDYLPDSGRPALGEFAEFSTAVPMQELKFVFAAAQLEVYQQNDRSGSTT